MSNNSPSSREVKRSDDKSVASVRVADLSNLLVMAARYAIGRQTYASAEVAEYVQRYAEYLTIRGRHVLIRDIEVAFKDHAVDELSTQPWHEAVDSLRHTDSQANTKPESELA